MRLIWFFATCLVSQSGFALSVAIDVSGLERAEKDNVMAFLSVERERKRPELTEARLRYLHRRAEGEIEQALVPFGFYQPQVESRFELVEDQYRLTYQITPGQRMTYHQIDVRIQGEGERELRTSHDFPIKAGDPVDHSQYEQSKQALLDRALQLGYLDARYNRQALRINLQDYQASLVLDLTTGPLFRFGPVTYQQDILDEAFVRRYQPFSAGERFDQEKLLALQAALLDSDYFSNAEIRTLRDQAVEGRLPVEVVLTPRKPNRYRTGIGFTTDVGPRLTLDWLRRRIGRQGHRMQSELKLSQPESSLTTEYIIPKDNPREEFISIGGGVEYHDTDTRIGTRYFVNIGDNKVLPEGWRQTTRLDFSYEDFEVAGVDETSMVLAPSIAWSRTKTDGRAFVLDGYRVNYKLQGAVEPILSDTSFLQAYSNDKVVFGLNDDWRVLTRLELGATLAESARAVPASYRYYAGGDSSVRGFQLEALGPKDSAGQVVGGRYLAVGSLEIERRIIGKWSGAVFTDFGNAFDPEYHNHVAYSAGFGVRWQSPVGPVQADLANALSKDSNSWRLHLVVGAEF